ncbi:hypothetical protein BDZ85DRAFT_318983 [Elsinoe ampelina]|uniref:BTB domain-containing protein n=1 Tax=Elsinoe ampelina TaxID=302913 RepID=A0A6A6GDK6_9PEZI|nr:hypothetical protein BDZ85DRAFT_318983 [Elsinoe ampelina]
MAPKRSQTRTRSKSKKRAAPYKTAKKAPTHVRSDSPEPSNGSDIGSEPSIQGHKAETLYKTTLTVTVGGGDYHVEESYECYPERLNDISGWFRQKTKKFSGDYSTAEVKIGFAAPEAFRMLYNFCLYDVDELIECYDLAHKLKAPEIQNSIVKLFYGARHEKTLFSAAIVKSVFSTRGNPLIPHKSGLCEFIKAWAVYSIEPSVLSGYTKDALLFMTQTFMTRMRANVDLMEAWTLVKLSDYLEDTGKAITRAGPTVRLRFAAGDQGQTNEGSEDGHPQIDGDSEMSN